MKRILFWFFPIFTVCFVFFTCTVKAKDEKVNVVYFYSPTCASCQKLDGFLSEIKKRRSDMLLIKHDISVLRYGSLKDKYCEAYKVNEKDEGIVPIIFVRDKYFTSEDEIVSHLESEITRTEGGDTMLIDVTGGNHDKDTQRFSGFSIISVAAAGTVNGLNPCSLSMLLFFLSILALKNKKILAAGIAFCTGKYIGFFLLGTVFFSLLSRIEFTIMVFVAKTAALTIITILVIMNIRDFFAAKNEKYDLIRLQLPKRIRKFNHNFLKMVSAVSDVKSIFILHFLVGIVISAGEFLCTGQIYLATIVTILQSNTELNSKALIYFLAYDLGFVFPPLVLTYLIFKGKEVFDLSGFIRERIPIIKLLSAILLFVLGMLIFFK